MKLLTLILYILNYVDVDDSVEHLLNTLRK